MNKHEVLLNRVRLMLLIFLVLIAAFWVWGYASGEGFVDRIVDLIRRSDSYQNVFLSLGIFWLFAVASVILGPFTSAPLVPIALLLWGDWATYWVLFSGWITGSIAAYVIGRHLGRPIVLKMIPEESVNAWQEFVSARGTFLIAFLFRLAMPAETGYIFGLVRYNFFKYVLITTIVESLTAAVLVFSGEALIDQSFFRFVLWIATIVIVLGATLYFLARRIRRRSI